MTNRVPTGISGLDSLIEGGVIAARTYFITGSAGSGKTILSSQFLYNGANRFGEKGLYVSFEEPVEDILSDLKRFDWELEKVIENGLLKYLYFPVLKDGFEENAFDLLTTILREVKDNGYKRLVIDSLPAFGMAFSDFNRLRKELFFLLHEIKKMGCTAFIITEKPSGDIGLTRFGVEDFLSQGLMVMHLGRTFRGIEVRKMRGTAHSNDIHRFRINENGITVFPGDHPF